jgi:hypothetical protein
VRDAGIDRDRRDAVRRVLLPMPPKSSSMPGSSVMVGRVQRILFQPINGSSASIALWAGRRSLPSKRQARRSTPEVTSNAPPESSWQLAAKSSRSAVSSSTTTGAPAAALMCDSALSAR